MSINAITQVVLELWGCVFCFIMIVTMNYIKDDRGISRKILTLMFASTAILLFMDSLAYIYRGYPGITGWRMVRITNFVVFSLSYLILWFYTLYLYSKFPREIQHKLIGWKRFIFCLCAAEQIILILNVFNGMCYYFDPANFYHRAGAYFLILIPGVLADIVSVIILFMNRKLLRRGDFLSLASYIIFPGTAMVLLLFYYGISLTNIAIMISMLFMFITAFRDHYEYMIAQAHEMADLREKILISQIEPHFIYNSLSTIKHLCRVAPDEAADAVTEFAAFLRTGIDSLDNDSCIPFSEEIEHTKNYLALEKRRFGDRVNADWHIENDTFQLPPFALQMIVENAVKHGITKRKDGGTITIAEEEDSENSCHRITISDNGVGFDTDAVLGCRPIESDDDELYNKISSRGHSHVGLRNVSQRLQHMCNASMTVQSTPDTGTAVIISIPVRGQSEAGK